MKIISIIRKQETEKENYTLITFENWRGIKKVDICISQKWQKDTIYAKTGKPIPVSLWPVVRSFLRTEETIHTY